MCGESPKTRDHRPFCSLRCRQLDLGRWLDGSYRIPGRPVDVDPHDPASDVAMPEEDGSAWDA
ncbi:MAG: DNA gyrase inhibitor YacG [Myxococcota bacterium]